MEMPYQSPYETLAGPKLAHQPMCGETLSVAVTEEWRNGPRQLTATTAIQESYYR